MVEQSAPTPSSINLRSKGLCKSVGKLHKGCVKDATSKLSIGSIPATYQSIIYRSQSKKAFGTSAKRFYRCGDAERFFNKDSSRIGSTADGSRMQSSQNFKDNSETMQDNSCYYGLVQGSRQGIRKDFNRQGHGAFISKVKRQWINSSKMPGPTHYYAKNQNKNEKNQNARKCKTRLIKYRKNLVTSAQNQKRWQNKQKNDNLPGPGSYLCDKKEMWKTTTKGWRSSFQTKVSRDGYIPDTESPGPGFYQSEENIKKKGNQKKNKNKQNSEPQSNVLDLIDEQKNESPGPGWYNHQIPNFKPLYEKIKMSNYFMAPIFVGKRKPKPSPGPTVYDVKRIYDNMHPKLIQSMAFMSETKRQAFQPADIYGPNMKTPQILGSKNFHFNINDEWL